MVSQTFLKSENIFYFYILFFNIYSFFLREGEGGENVSEWGGGVQRARETQNPKQSPDSELSARTTNREIMT